MIVDAQDFAYALTQVVHNLGAVAAAGSAVFARWPERGRERPLLRRLAWCALGGWAVQGASGAAFGAISFLGSGQLPDIHGIAIAALLLKMACAACGFVLSAVYLARESRWDESRIRTAWTALTALAATALAAAAFLRWFS